ncbi:MAG: hypothetical protein VB858_17105, partial [Planctomycetaceae bacterium]
MDPGSRFHFPGNLFDGNHRRHADDDLIRPKRKRIQQAQRLLWQCGHKNHVDLIDQSLIIRFHPDIGKPAGQACGALTAAFIFLPAMGLRYTIYAGAALNGLVFLAAAALARAVPASTEVPTGMTRGPFLILPLIAVSGMVSFIYEVLWVR